MTYSRHYKTLFEILIHHDYALNLGEEIFDEMPAADKSVQLSRYDFSSIVEVIPTSETVKLLKNQRWILRTNNEGIRIMAAVTADPKEPFIPISDNLALSFVMRVKDSYFSNFTDLALDSKRMLLFTNFKPVHEIPDPDPDPDPFSYISLSSESGDVTDNYKVSELSTKMLTEDLPDPEKIGLIGMFTIRMKGDPVANRDVVETVDDINYLREAAKTTFRIQFKNTHSFWRYYKKSVFLADTVHKWPLTKYGFITINPGTELLPPQLVQENYAYPNPGVSSIEKIGTVPDHQFYSVIFI